MTSSLSEMESDPFQGRFSALNLLNLLLLNLDLVLLVPFVFLWQANLASGKIHYFGKIQKVYFYKKLLLLK